MTSRPTPDAVTAAVASASEVEVVSAPSESTSTVRWPSLPARSTAASTASCRAVPRLSVSESTTARAASRSAVSTWGVATSPAKVTTPTSTSSGTRARKSRAARCAASNRAPDMELLVSMASTALRRTVPEEPAGAACAGTLAPPMRTAHRARVDVGVGRHRDQQRDAVGGGLGVGDARPVAGAARRGRRPDAQQHGHQPAEQRQQEQGPGAHQIRSVAKISGSTVTLA